MTLPLSGRNVLLVEDESLVLILMEDLLLELGASKVVSAMRLDEATRIARRAEVDLAIIDLNLAGSASYPVAEILRERGVPVVFATGYGAAWHDEAWRTMPTISKPVTAAALTEVLLTITPGIMPLVSSCAGSAPGVPGRVVSSR